MNQKLLVNISRATFVFLCCVMGILVSLSFGGSAWLGALSGVVFALFFVMVDGLLTGVTIRGFSSGTFGLMVGIFCAWLITRIGIFENPWMRGLVNYEAIRNLCEVGLYMALGFLGITLGLRSDREEFSFVIPYVRFRQEAVHDQPILVDTNVIIDGRIPGISRTGFISGSLLVPRFVIDELHLLADSKDAIKKERGKRGLDCLEEIRQESGLEVVIHEDTLPEEAQVDAKLIHLSRQLGARLLTNDMNLGKVAKLRGTPVLNLNRLARALRPSVMTGDQLDLTLVKKGKEEHQAVGYLADGTMLVVNNGGDRVGQTVLVTVTSTMQTSAGRLIFAEIK